MGTADTTSLKLSQNALLKALVGDLVCMYDVNVLNHFSHVGKMVFCLSSQSALNL